MANGDGDRAQARQDELERELQTSRDKIEALEASLDRVGTERDEYKGLQDAAALRAKEAETRAATAVAGREDVEAEAREAREKLVEAEREIGEAVESKRKAVERMKAAEAARKVAEDEAEAAVKQAQTAQSQEAEAERKLEANNIAVERFKEEQEARRGLQEFVRVALLDVMNGVDDAALEARANQVRGGASESGFAVASRIGRDNGPDRESLVDFDLAVIVGTSKAKGSGEIKDAKGGGKVSLNVLGLGFSAGASVRSESKKTTEERSEVSQHNRIRFSVPVVFARHGDPLA